MRYFKFQLWIIVLAIISTQSIALESANVQMHVGSLKMLPIKNIIRVAIGKGDVVSTKIIEEKGLLLIAEKPGRTELRVWREGERETRVSISVTPDDPALLISSVKGLIKNYPEVSAREVNGAVILEGYASEVEIKSLKELKSLMPNLIVMVKQKKVALEKMIKMELKVVEFSKKNLKNLGIKWDSVIGGPAAGYAGAATTNEYFGVYSDGGNGLGSKIAETLTGSGSSLLENAHFGYAGIVSGISSRINLMIESGEAKLLAEPMLSTRSGHSAEFLAGGEFPIAVPQDGGTNTIEFKEYGILLDIEPVADGEGNIQSSISTEVSTLDYSVAIQGVPGLLSRKTNTVIGVKEGETIVLSGLVSSSLSRTISKFPLLGDIPIIGELFKSTDFQNDKTELVIFVTPTIVELDKASSQNTLNRAQEMIETFRSQTGITVLD
ncbi:type II and III secretion system protein family protein [Aliikangiella sp. IMCC44653]